MLTKCINYLLSTGAIVCLLLSFVYMPRSAEAFVVQYGDTSITWNIENINPATVFSPQNNCRFVPYDPILGSGDYYYCEYIIWDPPADKEVILTSSVTSSKNNSTHSVDYYYLSQQELALNHNPKRIHSVEWVQPPLQTVDSGIGLYFWITDASYSIYYTNVLTESGLVGDRIRIEVKSYFSNPDLYLSRYGGPDDNDDTCYCNNNSYPERPGIKHCAKKRNGAGPGE
jgi:hypothetical protein